MSEFLGINLDSLTSYSIVLLIPEIIIFIIFKHDGAGWKYRFSSGQTISTSRVAIGIFVIVVILFFAGDEISAFIEDFMKEFSYTELLAPTTLLVTFVWIWHYIVGKKLNRQMGFMLITAAILSGLFFWLNSGYVSLD